MLPLASTWAAEGGSTCTASICPVISALTRAVTSGIAVITTLSNLTSEGSQ